MAELQTKSKVKEPTKKAKVKVAEPKTTPLPEPDRKVGVSQPEEEQPKLKKSHASEAPQRPQLPLEVSGEAAHLATFVGELGSLRVTLRALKDKCKSTLAQDAFKEVDKRILRISTELRGITRNVDRELKSVKA